MFAQEVARATAERGHYVELWAPDHPAAVNRSWPFRFRPIAFAGTQNVTCQLKLALAMIDHRRQLRKSIVYLPEPGAMLGMTYLHHFRAFKPRAIVLTFHGSEVLRFAQVATLRLLIGQLIRRAALVTAPSSYTLGLLHHHFPESRGKTALTPGALRRGVIPQRHSQPRPVDRLVLLTVARLHPRKGQHAVLEALSRLPDRLRRRVEYWLVGEGEKEGYGTRLQYRAASLDLPVRFFPSVADDQLPSFYAAADIFALTSMPHGSSVEGYGLVYLEAAAHALPVLGHAIGGVPEAVANGVTGLLVPPDDRDALTAALGRLIEDADLRRRLGAAGQAAAFATSWHAVSESLFTLSGGDPTIPRSDLKPAATLAQAV